MSRLVRFVVISALVAGGLLAAVAPAAAAASPTVVSLTFDDGLPDQIPAAATLNGAGMHATYFINSGRIGTSGYMTRANLDSLAAAGNEIAGHTVSHLNLAALTPDGQRRQICNDRATLMSWGFGAKNFAYPFSSFNSDTLAIVAECGYNSARLVGGLVSGSNCNGCPLADSIPPADPYQIRAPDSIKTDTSLAALEKYVTQAENGGGGWVPLVFHHVCDACDPNSIKPSDFASFISWLAARPGTTSVQTVDQVIGGQLNPAPATIPPGPGTSELQNPDLEIDANSDSVPDCWQTAGFGTNSATFSRSTDAHSGSFAERLAMTSFTDGGRRLVVRQDDGACSPAIVGGDRATLSAWYKSDQPVRMSVFYRDGSDVWHPWNTSPAFPASASYRQATYLTPALPSDAIGISFGLTLQAVGTLVTDDYGLDVTIEDTIAPIVALSGPAEGSTVSGHAVALTAAASDETAVSRVDFLINGTVVGSDTSAPYGVSWDSTTAPNGSATITAVATDTSGNSTTSDAREVTVSNGASTFGVTNGGLEDDANGDAVPDCWQLAGTGTNTFAFTRTTDAHSGGSAERIDISSYTDGSRRLVVRQDAGPCAIAIVAGHQYTLSAWVKGTAPSRLTAFYRDATGTWITWSNGPIVAASATYAQMTWTTPAVPAGATHLSFGVSLSAAGSITVDDHAIASDANAPTATLTTPAANAIVSGTSVAMAATATDDVAVARVDFLADGAVVGSDTTAPYTFAWDSTTVADGPVSLAARATDTGDNATTSAAVPVTVANGATGWGVQNASLEVDANADSVPDCWQNSSSGTQTGSFTRTTDAHSGSFAERADITAYTSGARRTVVKQDAGACAVAVVPGNAYTLSAWVKGSGTIRMTAFFGTNGTWSPTTSNGPTGAASASWSQLTWTTGAVPAGTTHLSFGVTLQSVGSISVDDLAINGSAPSDTTPPTVSLTAPAAGATVHGAVTLSATASDDRGIASVDFLVDGTVVGTDTTAPYSTTWDSTAATDGTVSLTARATDTSSNATTSASRSIGVDNSGPTVAITEPTDGASISGSVTISANATDTSGIASVDFLVDGAVVGTDTAAPYSTSWDSSAATDGSHAITARARDTVGNVTTSAAVGVTVASSDVNPPTVALTAPVDGASVSGDVTISADAADDHAVAAVEFLVDGVSVGTDTTAPYSITWDSTTQPSGATVSITARATDAAGNGATSAARSVTIDNGVTDAPPTVALTAPADGTNVSGTVTISADATDDVAIASVEFLVGTTSIGTDTSAPYSVAWDTTAMADGSAAITARATDTAGQATTSAARTVVVDNKAPTVALVTPAAGASVSASTTLSATASDASGIAKVEFLVDGAVVGTDTTAPYSTSWDSTTTPDGNVSITARATDTTGTTGTSAARSVSVDNSAPVVGITSPADGAIVSGPVNIFAGVTDASPVTVEFLVNGAVVNTDSTPPSYDTTWDSTSVPDGPVTIAARATDGAGNVATSASRTIQVRNTPVDTSPPTVGLSSPADGSAVSGSITISATASDDTAVDHVDFLVGTTVVGTDATTPYSISWDSTTVPDGVVAITARAVDSSANATTSAARSATVDNNPPETTIDAGPSGTSVVDTATFSFSSSETGSTFRCSLDGAAPTVCTSPKAYSGLTNAGHTFSVTATDAAGNADPTAATRAWTVNVPDTTAPTVSLTAPAAGARVGGTAVTISASAADDRAVDRVEFLVGSTVVGTDSTSPYSVSWNSSGTADGTASITARAVDTSANATTSAARTVTIDNTGPAVELTAPASGATVSGNKVTLSATATDGGGVTSVAFVVNGTVVATDTSSPYSVSWNSKTVADGAKTLTARATDGVGNVTLSAARTVTVQNGPGPDVTPPAVSLSAPAAGATVAGTAVTISATASDNVGVVRLEFLVDATVVGTDTSSPYSVSWNSTSVANGSVSITARAIDAAANSATSAARSVTVANQSPVLQNAGLESGSGTTPDCWQTGSSGNNSTSFARVSDAHSGSFSERITVSSYKNGRATFVSRADSTCGIAGIPGRAYQIGLWAKGNGTIRLTATYRDSSGSWVTWTSGGTTAATTGWTQTQYTTPALPAGATLLSFGVSVESNAVVTVDDFSISLAP
ncbi:MAG TPA: Ig-like domain-containing protein [Candidatus Limnocylindrales bacterium]|nr:Ig-like domain-containing protein [Candidatus Limnocylindrales bacterium]